MSHTYTAETLWSRGEQPFTDRRYSRRHLLRFDGGLEIPASSSPLSVRAPYSDPQAADPEELLVAAVSSCHMLWFLDIAARAGFVVERYHDQAAGEMTPNENGKLWLSSITLRPQVGFAGDRQPTAAELDALHHEAHAECFIANSIKSAVQVQPR